MYLLCRVKLLKHGSDKPLGFYIRDGTSVRVTPQVNSHNEVITASGGKHLNVCECSYSFLVFGPILPEL